MAWSKAWWALLISFTPTGLVAQLTSPISYPNRTSSSIVTAPPLTTGPTNRDWGCAPCAINANAAPSGGLQQVVWYTESISLTLDTVSIFVTTYNGSNATAITRHSTIYGDINTVDVRNIRAAQSIYSTSIFYQAEQYMGGGGIFLARGTDGSIGSTVSYEWPTNYILISAIASTTTVPFSGCPSGLQQVRSSVLAGSDCGCVLTSDSIPVRPVDVPGLSTTEVPLPSNFYFPISPMELNMTQLQRGFFVQYPPLNRTELHSWLLKQPWASTLLPNLQHCTDIDAAQGPPGVKIPVAALTTTITITTNAVSSPASVSVKPSSSYALPGPYPSSIPTSTPTLVLRPSLSTASYSKGSSNVPSDTSVSKDGGTVTHSGGSSTSSSNDNAAVTSSGGSVLNNGGESAVSVGTASSPSTALTAETSGASVSTSKRVSSVVDNSEVHPNSSPTSAIAMPTTQVVVASQTILLPSSAVSQLVVAGTTLAATGPAATIGGQVVSLQSNALVVSTSTNSFVGPEETTPVATVGGDVVHTLTDIGAFVVAGTTLKPGASAVTIAGTAVSLDSSNLMVGSSTVAIPSAPSDVIHITSTQLITPYPSDVVTFGHTITKGAPAMTISGTTISLGSSGLAIGSNLVSLTFSASSTVLTVAGQVITPLANSIIIAGQTISQGAPAVTASGTIISLGPSGLVLDSSTIPLPTQAPSPTTFILGDHTFTATAAAIAIAGTTPTEGASAATISGTPISFGPSGVIIGSSTYTLPTSLPSSLATVNDVIFAINPTGVQLSGSTLSVDGSAITIHGTKISLGTAGLVVGTSTIPYDNGASSQATQQGIGSAIIAGFGTPNTSTEAISSTAPGALSSTTTAAISSTAPAATTSLTTNGTTPSETVFRPVHSGGATTLISSPWLVTIVVLGMTLVGR